MKTGNEKQIEKKFKVTNDVKKKSKEEIRRTRFDIKIV